MIAIGQFFPDDEIATAWQWALANIASPLRRSRIEDRARISGTVTEDEAMLWRMRWGGRFRDQLEIKVATLVTLTLPHHEYQYVPQRWNWWRDVGPRPNCLPVMVSERDMIETLTFLNDDDMIEFKLRYL